MDIIRNQLASADTIIMVTYYAAREFAEEIGEALPLEVVLSGIEPVRISKSGTATGTTR
jgi:hypothetical protein